MNYKHDITQLEEKLNTLTSEISSLSGRHNLLSEQIEQSKKKLEEIAHKREIYKKSIELLTFVQQTTKEKIKEGFENLVTYALRYIYNNDYKFELKFGRRGNLQELDFNVKTPDFKEAFDPLDTSGGGVLDIISFALRVSLLELANPKIEGFIVLDESFKHLSQNYLANAKRFLEAINKRINRQIILITHKPELVANIANTIEVK